MTPADHASATGPIDRLIRRLDLSPGTSEDQWIGSAGAGALNGTGRLFGGLVVAQTIVAAGRSVEDRTIHCVQQVFLRGGQASSPLTYDIERVFTGRTYASLLVTVSQDDAIISQAHVGLSSGIDGPDRAELNQLPLVDLADTVNRAEHRGHPHWADEPIEFRVSAERQDGSQPELDVWFKPVGQAPNDPLIHQALVGFASDRALLGVAWKPHASDGAMIGATVNHTVWFHRPVTLDNWHSYIMHSPTMSDGRGMVHGAMYDRDGQHVVSTAQEGTFRLLDR